MTTTTPETRRFEAEVAQVLNLVTHSLYSHKEIFLRELVSNASDACDKLRFAAIAEPTLLADDTGLRIELEYDKDERTITVRDNGIGMAREEVIENIGTIARSGTRKFLESLSGDARKDTQLIGQFGVGFYSAFIVADKVTLTTRKSGTAQGVRWESTGTGEYTIADIDDARRGTEVVLHLKAEESEFLSGWKLRELVAKYSDHIGFPIGMRKEGEEGQGEWETVNHAAALWTRQKAELADDDYKAFYKHLSHDFSDPLAWTHNRVEGNQSYALLLYLPERAPFDAMWTGRDDRKGLRLYIRRVFIMDASEQLLPAYLRFVRGVVDSDDLPLNVSREILQENRLVQQIRASLVKRTLDLLDKLATDDKDKYANFWKEFGAVLKEGLAEDHGNRERIAKLLRFTSTASVGREPDTSLDEYIARMKEGQDAIWFVTAEGFNAARSSPQIEALKQRGVEVLLLHERIDEWMIGHLNEYAGKRLKNVAKGELDLGKLADSADQAKREADAAAAAPVVARMKELLGERVRDVRASRRLTDSASCLVCEEHDMGPQMARLLKQAGHEVPDTKPILEINPSHPLVKRLETEPDADRARDLGEILLDQAQLAEGGHLDDPAAHVRRVNALLVATLK